MSLFLKRFFIILFSFFVLFVIITSALTFIYQGRITKQVEETLSHYLKTKFIFKSARFDYLNPQIELRLTLQEFEFQDKTLGGVETIHFVFALTDLIQGNFSVYKIKLEKPTLHLFIDEKGQANYTDIFHLQKPAEKKAVALKLRYFQVRTGEFRLTNRSSQEQYQMLIPQFNSELNPDEAVLPIVLNAQLKDLKYTFQKKVLIHEPSLSIEGDYTFDPKDYQIVWKSPQVQVKESLYQVEGISIITNEGPALDLSITSPQNGLEPLISLVPQKIYNKLAFFKTEGNLQFSSRIKGFWTKDQNPHWELSVKAEDLAIRSPHNIGRAIEKFNLIAKLDNGAKNSFQNASLTIQKLTGELGGKKFRGNFQLNNLLKPSIQLDLEAVLDLAILQEFYPFEGIEEMKGLISLDMNGQGNLYALQDSNPSDTSWKMTGEAELINVTFQPKKHPLYYQNLNAEWQLNNDQINIQKFSGKVNESAFNLKGTAYSLLSGLFQENQRAWVEGEFSANTLSLDRIYPYALGLPPNLGFTLNCQIKHLNFRKLKAQNLKGTLNLNRQVWETDNLSGQWAGGNFNLVALFNTQKNNAMPLDTRIQLQGVALDKAFTQFNNFSQSFIRADNFKGKLDSDIKLNLVLNKQLKTSFPSLIAEIRSEMSQGQIQEMALLEQLSQKLGLVSALPLSFKSLKNTLEIRNQNVLIPETELISDKLSLSLFGRSSTTQDADYKIKVFQINLPADTSRSRLQMDANQENRYLDVRGNLQNPQVNISQLPSGLKPERFWEREKKMYNNLFDDPQWAEPAVKDTIQNN